ncbi:MAG: 3-deoxy-D-manno-octulosonic acid transferase [Sphingobacteriaceae bacterium]
MLLVYNLVITIYYWLIRLATPFNKKAFSWVKGRKTQKIIPVSESIWFHFASLGEFEQGRPVLEKIRAAQPESILVITFFSPSGYEIRRNTPLADYVYYLPLDTAANARNFIDSIQPKLVVFTKYEYWYHYFNVLHQRNVPLYIVSAIFRPKQIFFRWYGSLHRQMLSCVTYFFVQDEFSKQFLKKLHFENVTDTGDTRFDRVWENTKSVRKYEAIEKFKADQLIFIAGSTWPKDEALIAHLILLYPDWKFIVAPHEMAGDRIDQLVMLFPKHSAIRYSEIENPLNLDRLAKSRVLIIDNIGMLSALYQYGNIAYIGGGFGVGVHNTLEAAAFGLPVIFGPNYQKFREIRDLIALKAGFSVQNEKELQVLTDHFYQNKRSYQQSGKTAMQYVESHTGSTEKIMKLIHSK